MTKKYFKKLLLLAFNCAVLTSTSSLRASYGFSSCQWCKFSFDKQKISLSSGKMLSSKNLSSLLKHSLDLSLFSYKASSSTLWTIEFISKRESKAQLIFPNSGRDPPLI